VNIKIAGKWMFIPLKMVFIGIDPYPLLTKIHIRGLPAIGVPPSSHPFIDGIFREIFTI
jgi:hypothetical protein